MNSSDLNHTLNGVEFSVPTDAGFHRISWKNGRLTLHSHNLLVERTIRALGGPPCPCLLVYDVLTNRSDISGLDRIQLLAARRALRSLSADSYYSALTASERKALMLRIRRRIVSHLIPGEMLEIIGRAEALRDERRAAANASIQQPVDAEELLRRKAIPALEQSVRRASVALWSDAPIMTECWKQRQGQGLALLGSVGQSWGFVFISLPISWLNRVWRRGIAIIDGRFIISVDQCAPATELKCDSISWVAAPGDSLAPVVSSCVLQRPRGGQWTIH
jgi:hypothetical protein